MSFMEAIQFPFQDEKWVNKFLITVVLLFIPIIGWLIIYGFVIRMIRNVQTDVNRLPEYDDFGGDLSRGFMAAIGSLVYYIPSILLSCCSSVLNNSDSGGAAALSCLISLAQFGYNIIILPFVASALAHFAHNEQLSTSFFDFNSRVNDVTSRIGDAVMYVLNYFIIGIIGAVATAVGLILCCIPGLIAIAAFQFATAHLVGQWSKIIGVSGGASANYGTPPTIQPLG